MEKYTSTWSVLNSRLSFWMHTSITLYKYLWGGDSVKILLHLDDQIKEGAWNAKHFLNFSRFLPNHSLPPLSSSATIPLSPLPPPNDWKKFFFPQMLSSDCIFIRNYEKEGKCKSWMKQVRVEGNLSFNELDQNNETCSVFPTTVTGTMHPPLRKLRQQD